MIHIGFSGTQKGMTQRQLTSLRARLTGIQDVVFHHGDCIGADFQAHVLARELGFKVVVHPPTVSSKRSWCVGDEERVKAPYLERNRDIVDESNVVILAPNTSIEMRRSGTWSTWRYAKRIGRPWIMIYPDGTFRRSGEGEEVHLSREVDGGRTYAAYC